MRSHTKFGVYRFSRFDIYWLQADRQADTQTDKQIIYIEENKMAKNKNGE